MVSNKKSSMGIIALGLFLSVFTIIFTMWLFMYQFTFQVADEELISPLNNISLQIMNTEGINSSAQMKAHVASLPQKFRDTDLAADLYFVIFFTSIVMTGAWAALKAKKEGMMSFFGTTLIGIMIYFLVVGYFETVRIWLMDNLVLGVAQVDLSQTILMESYIANIVEVNFIILIIYIVLNQFDFTGITKEGRAEV